MPGLSVFTTRPLYLQVRDRLGQRIATGDWKPGGALPNETDLALELGVSSGTVRKALDQLEMERVVVRKQGKGTFVIDHNTDEMSIRFSNIRDSGGNRMSGYVSWIDQTTGTANALERRNLKLGEADVVHRTRQVRSDGTRIFMYEETSLPLRRFPGMQAISTEYQRFAARAQAHGVLLGRAVESAAAELVDDNVAGQLKIDAGTPVLKLDRIIYSSDDAPVHWRLAWCVLGDMSYVSDMT